MQEDGAIECGDLLAATIGATLAVTGEVSEVAGVFRRGTTDYLRHLVGTGAAFRGYFGGSDRDLDSEFEIEGVRETYERRFAGATEYGRRWDGEIGVEACFDRDAGEVDFAVVLDGFMRGR